MRSPDPTIPRGDYDPDAPNPGLEEIRRQKAAGVADDDLDWGLAIAKLNESHGRVLEKGKWVLNEPYTSRNIGPDGAA